MLNPRQFSLAYLLLETLWIGASLASFRAVWVASSGRDPITPFLLLAIAVVATGAAVGGMFGRMAGGVVWAFSLVFVLLIASFVLIFGAAMLS